jgi:serine acetyltransferase
MSLFILLWIWSKELAFLATTCLHEGNAMRIFMICAITMAAAIGLGGCFWHHQAAVVTQPAPPLK